MRRFLFSLTILIFGMMVCNCSYNSSDKNSAKNQTRLLSSDDTLNRLDSIVNACRVSDIARARKFGQLALSIGLQSNSEEILARSFLIMGIALSYQNSDSSFMYYSKALKLSQNCHSDWIQSKALYNLAMIYMFAFDQKTALMLLDSAICISRKAKDFSMLSNAFNVLGNLKMDLQDTAGSKVMYDSAIHIAKAHNISNQLGIALASLSRFERKYEESEKMRKKAIEVLRSQSGNEEEIAAIYNNIGMRNPNPDTAINCFESAIKIANNGNCPEVLIASYNNLAYSLLDKKEIEKAEDCLVNHAIPIAERLDNLDLLSNLHDSYCDIMIAAGNKDEALAHERIALQLRYKADQRKASGQIRLLAALLDVKNKELRIQNNEHDLQIKESKIRFIAFLLFSTLMILLLTIILYQWKVQRNKLNSQKSLLESAKKLIDMEENVKGRVAMELHDLTTPFYTVMSQQIEKAQIGDGKIESDLKIGLSNMTENIRQISHRMDNNFIGQLSVTELVRGLCNDLRPVSSASITCTLHPEDFDLGNEKTIHIYRIVQELLTNAVKYVFSGEISLSLSKESGMLVILYQDSGPGFDMNCQGKIGLGINNILERAKILNGKALLSSNLGKGTKWNIVIPV
jgi:signal transduction histidine kinase